MIAGLFWQIGVIVVDLCYFALFEMICSLKMIKSVKVFLFSFVLLHKNQTPIAMLQNGHQAIQLLER